MPLGLPGITAGAGSSIPISAGGGTSGPATSGVSGAPISIGGLFGSSATARSNPNLLMPLIIGGAILLGVLLIRR